MSAGTMFLRACGAGYELVAMVERKLDQLTLADRVERMQRKAHRSMDLMGLADAAWAGALCGGVDVRSSEYARIALRQRRCVKVAHARVDRLARMIGGLR